MSKAVAIELSTPLRNVFEVVDLPHAGRQLWLAWRGAPSRSNPVSAPARERTVQSVRRPPRDIYELLARRRREAQIRARHALEREE